MLWDIALVYTSFSCQFPLFHYFHYFHYILVTRCCILTRFLHNLLLQYGFGIWKKRNRHYLYKFLPKSFITFSFLWWAKSKVDATGPNELIYDVTRVSMRFGSLGIQSIGMYSSLRVADPPATKVKRKATWTHQIPLPLLRRNGSFEIPVYLPCKRIDSVDRLIASSSLIISWFLGRYHNNRR